jgi:hypothetical protein
VNGSVVSRGCSGVNTGVCPGLIAANGTGGSGGGHGGVGGQPAGGGVAGGCVYGTASTPAFSGSRGGGQYGGSGGGFIRVRCVDAACYDIIARGAVGVSVAVAVGWPRLVHVVLCRSKDWSCFRLARWAL